MTSAGSIVNIAMLSPVIAPIVAVYLLLDWDNLIARINGPDPTRSCTWWCAALQVKLMHNPIRICARNGKRVFNPWDLLRRCADGGWVELWASSLAWLAGLWSHSFPTWAPWLVGPWPLGLGLVSILGGLVIPCDCGRHLFFAGQMIEGNYLTPKLVGSSVGVAPRLAFAGALSVFGALFGFIGMLIAVPLAATLGVLARFVTARSI